MLVRTRVGGLGMFGISALLAAVAYAGVSGARSASAACAVARSSVVAAKPKTRSVSCPAE